MALFVLPAIYGLVLRHRPHARPGQAGAESETGMPQYDSVAGKVYVNLRTTNEIAAINPATDTVVGKYPVEGCRYNHGMAMYSEHDRAFLLCAGTGCSRFSRSIRTRQSLVPRCREERTFSLDVRARPSPTAGSRWREPRGACPA